MVVATDAAGNEARYSTVMVLDDLAPDVHVDELPEWVSEGTVLVTGRVTDACGSCSLVCNGEPVTLDVTGGFSLELEVPEGGLDIYLVATDLAGNEAIWSGSVDQGRTSLPAGGWLVLALVLLIGCVTALTYYGRRR
jgi:hypothetical protein